MVVVPVKAWADHRGGGTTYYIDGKEVAGIGGVVPLSSLAGWSRGGLIVGGAAEWESQALGGIAGSVVTRNATDTLWSTFALAGTAAQTYTFPAASASIPGGSGTATRLAEWGGANALQASTLIKSGAGVLTLSAAGAYTATVPATGTVAMLETANSFTLINPLTTIAESWIGPSATAGIYFKDGYVSIGTTASWEKLAVAGNFAVRTFLDTSSAYGVSFSKSRGSEVSPSAVLANDTLGFFSGGGYHGAGWHYYKTLLAFRAAENFTSTNSPTYILFRTTPSGSTTPVDVLRLNEAGNVLLGTTTDGMTAAGSLAIARDLAHRGTKAGFFNIPPATRPSAFTQTYATAAKTIAALTYAAPSGGATVDTEGRASLAQLAADVLAMKQNDNAIIDDGQILGLLQ